MSRPRKGTPGHKQALKKWRKTMIEHYGSVEAYKEFLRERGAKGGRNGCTGGFYANPELARIAGAKGGKTSRRNYTYVGRTIFGGKKYINEKTGELEVVK